MGLVKCPRCELNYMQDSEKYCEVCRREIRREDKSADPVDLCPECNENPVVKRKGLCIFCLKERKRQQSLNAFDQPVTDGDLDMPGVSELEEIDIDVDGDIPESELEEIDEALDNKDEDDAYDADDYSDREDEGEDDDEFEGFSIEELE